MITFVSSRATMRAVRDKAKAEKQLTPPPSLSIVHRTDQRWRVHVPAIYDEPDAAARLERFLQKKSQLQKVSARPATGSLILESSSLQRLSLHTLDQWVKSAFAMEEESPENPAAAEARHRKILEAAMSPEPEAILRSMHVSRNRGLPADDVERRRKKFGSNSLTEERPTPKWDMLRRQFQNSQTAILAGSAVLSAATGGLFELVMISGVVLINGYISYLTEAQAERIILSIGKIEPAPVQVLRAGERKFILDHELVVGDIIFLSSGVVPADARLLESKGLMVDESSLTGESMPVSKHQAALQNESLLTTGERMNLVFRGTVITSGQGVAVVLAVGENTEVGRIRKLVSTAEVRLSPLQNDLNHISHQSIIASGLICGGIFAIGLGRGRGLLSMLHASISLAVAAVPEGLPTIGTTTMALGVSKLKRSSVLVRRLSVLETLGSVDVLCFDKTGTLTTNEMLADEAYFGFWHWTRDQTLAPEQGALPPDHPERLTVFTWSKIAVLCSDYEFHRDATAKEMPNGQGSATERAILELAVHFGMEPLPLRTQYPRYKVRYRRESRQYMVTYHHKDDGQDFAAVKGNPEQLIQLVAWVMDQGKIKPMSESMKSRILDQNRELASKGLRVLGFAYLEAERISSIREQRLIWVGLVGLLDPMREGMSQLMEKFGRAGIKAIMLTGDQAETARALGLSLGMDRGSGQLKTADARDLSLLTLEQIADLAEEVQIFSRISPSDKLRIVQGLQARGHIVAMTGDGVNDSPALKAAHVGIALGSQGSSAARESADIVLQDNNLQTLFHAIEQGRTVRGNLRKSIRYLLATNLSEMLLTFAAIVRGRQTPLNPVQLMWINLLSDVLPGLALALDPARKGIMDEMPLDPGSPLLSEEIKWRLLREAVLIGLGAYLSQGHERSDTDDFSGSSSAFVSLTLSQILHTLSVSADKQSLWQGPWPKNAKIYEAMGLGLLTLVAGIFSPLVQTMLGNRKLSLEEWQQAIFHGTWPLAAHEALKLFFPGPSMARDFH